MVQLLSWLEKTWAIFTWTLYNMMLMRCTYTFGAEATIIPKFKNLSDWNITCVSLTWRSLRLHFSHETPDRSKCSINYMSNSISLIEHLQGRFESEGELSVFCLVAKNSWPIVTVWHDHWPVLRKHLCHSCFLFIHVTLSVRCFVKGMIALVPLWSPNQAFAVNQTQFILLNLLYSHSYFHS